MCAMTLLIKYRPALIGAILVEKVFLLSMTTQKL
jgi:hypothetical protein